jgi:AcrR family transcriptional regulator
MVKKKRRERRKDDRPGEILQAAVDEFTENGFANAKIQSIATRAGVAKGTVYLYYATKEEIFEAIVRDRIRPVFDVAAAMSKQWQGTQADLFRQIITHFYGQMIESDERRMILKILVSEGERFGELAAFYHREILVGARKMLRELIRTGIEKGEFRDGAYAREPTILVAPAMFAAIWKMTFDSVEKLNTRRWLDAHLDVVLFALRP